MQRRAQATRPIGFVALTVGLIACSAGRNEPAAGTAGSPSPAVASASTVGNSSSASAVRSTTASAPASAATGPTSTSGVATGAGSVGPAPRPAALDELEANAEDVIDLVADEGWGKVTSDIEAMQAAWAGYRQSAAAADGVLAEALGGALGTLSTAADAKDAASAAQAANDVSRAVVELFAHYALARPIQIGRLDVIGRQIALDADSDRLVDASAQVVAAREQWAAIRDDVIAHDGDEVAARTVAALSALDRAIAAGDAEATNARAADLLEIVDSMEGLY